VPIAAIVTPLDASGREFLSFFIEEDFSLNAEVEGARICTINVGQAFQPAGSPDFPVRLRGDWRVASTRRHESLPHASSCACRWPTSEFRFSLTAGKSPAIFNRTKVHRNGS